MRHGASLLASLEGMNRTAYRIGRELANNSRSGLTVRFLAKKLDASEEEVEYLLDINHRLMFTDLTKIKLVPEGHQALKRITDGLESHGDVPSMLNRVRGLDPHDFRRLEERLGSDQSLAKKAAGELLLEKCYRHPDSVVNYVGSRGFSNTAREVFDVLWQSRDGVMPVSQLRAVHGGSEYDVEQALWELFQGFACFELFRFDHEERLVRAVALLSEIRQWRKSGGLEHSGAPKLRPIRGGVDSGEDRGLQLSDTVCRIVAAVAARPVRLRGDGDLFREDRRRLEEICTEEDEPSLNTCLWMASGGGWLAMVDNTLQTVNLDPMVGMKRLDRQKMLYDWMLSRAEEAQSRRTMESLAEEMKHDVWYTLADIVAYAMSRSENKTRPILKAVGAHYEYIGPAVTGRSENRLARSLEESLFWLGVFRRGYYDGEPCFQLTPLGRALLTCNPLDSLIQQYPDLKGEIVVQPNFDIVAPMQDMDPLITVPLDQFAVKVSSGQVAVYSLTKDSFVQAVQNGHSAAAFIDFLMQHNRGGRLPENVIATLEDWGGGIKRVRIRTYHVVESDDPLVIAELLHRRKLGKYLEEIDPRKSVRFKDMTRTELSKSLEKEGFLIE